MKLSLMTFIMEYPLLYFEKDEERRRQNYEEILQGASEAGFQYIDISHPMILAIGADNMEQLLEKYHLQINCLTYLNVLESEEQLPVVMELAQRFDCKKMMLVPGIAEGEKDTIYQKMVNAFRKIVKEAEKYGITCMIEDDPDVRLPMCSTAEMHALFDAVPGLQMVYDTANMLVNGEEPLDYYEEFAEYVRHVHLKDIIVTEQQPEGHADLGIDGRFYMNAPHGKGVIQFDAILDTLQQHGYNDTLAVEFVPQKDVPLKQDLQQIYRKFVM